MVVRIMVVEDIMEEGAMAEAGAMAAPVSDFILARRYILILTTATLTGTRIIIRRP